MKKGTIWKNIIMIISVWVIVIVATFSWFVYGINVDVNNILVHVGEASYVQISGDGGGSWSDSLDIEIGVNKMLKEMSGDGTKLFTPVYDVVKKPGGGFGPAIITYEEVQDKTYYYEQIFDFRSDADYDLYLDPSSYIAPVTDNEDASIVGAIRVGFFELDDNGEETLKYIWAPNSTIEFSPDTGTFNAEGTVESNYYYQQTLTPVDMDDLAGGEPNPNVVKIPVTVSDDPETCPGCGYNEEHRFMWSCGKHLPENAPVLLDLHLNGQTIAEKRIKIKVWLEGYDRECVSQISGQRFTMNFQFKAEKENNDE